MGQFYPHDTPVDQKISSSPFYWSTKGLLMLQDTTHTHTHNIPVCVGLLLHSPQFFSFLSFVTFICVPFGCTNRRH